MAPKPPIGRAEGVALLRVGGGDVERGLRDADRLGGDADAPAVERLEARCACRRPARRAARPGVSSKLRSAVEEEFRPSFSSSRVTREARPRRGARRRPTARSGSRAKTRKLWACEPLVIHCLVPVMRASSSARVRIAPASEPEPDSVSAKAASSWPWASGGTSRPTCSGVPWAQHRQRAGARVDGDGHAHPGVGARELLEHEHVGEEVGARAAVLLGHADAHQPELAEVRRRPRAGSVCSRSQAAGVRRDLLVGEAPGEVADLALLVGELVQAHRLPHRHRARAGAHERGAGPRRAAAFSRRPSCSKRMTSQPSSRATRRSSASGLTATGWPTARSIGRSDSESE